MANPFDHLHIKGRTAGSSNELSFDVLDAAASSDPSTKRRSGRGARAGRASSSSRSARFPQSTGASLPVKGAYHGGSGVATLSSAPEVERRKRARRTHALRARLVGIAVLVVLVGVASFFSYRFYQERIDFTGHFNTLIGELTEIDRTLAEIDGLMRSPLNSVEASQRNAALKEMPNLTRRLAALADETRTLVPQANSPVSIDEAALEELRLTAEARQEMIRAATSAFELSDQVSEHVDAARRTWDAVLEADSDVRDATEIANAATTEDETLKSREITQGARDAFERAVEQFGQLEKTIGRGNLFTAQKNYLERRIVALDHALATTDALMANDREGAAVENDAYNAADQLAATSAANLPADIAEQVKAAFDDDLQAASDDYADARAHVTQSDAALRSHLP